jgi:peptide methionine sulfoxide reductase MsrB
MIRSLIFLGLVVFGSAAYADPFNPCYVEKTVVKVKDARGEEKVSEVSKTVCTDRLGHVLQDTGAARYCGLYTYTVTLQGRPVEQQGLACEKFNGSWEIIANYNNR